MRNIKPVNNHILIQPKEHKSFISSEKGTYEEVGIVLKVADGISTIKPNDEVFFDSWLAGKFPAEEGKFIWLVNYSDIKAINREDV